MPFVDHIDYRVSNVAAVRELYAALFTALGMEAGPSQTRPNFSHWVNERRYEFVIVSEAPEALPSLTRIAFKAESREMVDRVAAAIRAAGAQKMEGPAIHDEYDATFYAVFFEDALGNKFEVCHHDLKRR